MKTSIFFISLFINFSLNCFGSETITTKKPPSTPDEASKKQKKKKEKEVEQIIRDFILRKIELGSDLDQLLYEGGNTLLCCAIYQDDLDLVKALVAGK